MHRWAGAGSWNYQARDTLQEAPLYRVLKLMRRGVMSEVMDTYLTTSLPHYLTTSLPRARRTLWNSICAVKSPPPIMLRMSGSTCCFANMVLVPSATSWRTCSPTPGFCYAKKLSEMPDGEWHAEDYRYHSAIATPSMRSRPVCAAPRGSGRYRDHGNRATIGRKAAVIDFGWIHLRGLVAWLI
jgi:hypothetical protein